MSKNRSAAGITNIVQYDANKNITFVSGSTTLLTVSSSGALTTTSTITAQTLVVQTVTSSVNFITGSTKFGSLSSNTHTFTGSVLVTGSVTSNGLVTFTSANNGRIFTSTGATTGYQYAEMINTGGNLNIGVASSTGAIWGSGNGGAYNSAIGTANATDFVIGTNNIGRIIVNSDGNVAIGTTPSNWASGTEFALQVKAASIYSYGNYEAGFSANTFYNSGWKYIAASSTTATQIQLTNGNILFNNAPAGTAGNAITFTERMRIQSDGSVLVGTTNDGFFNGSVQGTGLFGSNGFIAASRNGGSSAFFNRYTSTGDVVNFRYAGSNVGSISTNGSTVTFSGNAASDNRLKDEITPINNALEAINSVEWVKFKYKSNGFKSAGVTAQQLKTTSLADFVIDGMNEEDYKAVDYNAIIGYLGKAIQELKAEIDALKAQ